MLCPHCQVEVPGKPVTCPNCKQKLRSLNTAATPKTAVPRQASAPYATPNAMQNPYANPNAVQNPYAQPPMIQQQPYMPQQPYYPGMAPYGDPGAAKTGTIIGYIGLGAWLLPILGLPLAIIGLIFARKGKSSKATTLNVIALILSIINSVIGAAMAM